MNLTRTQWPLGWTPSADDTNGSPQGLLRMDNLHMSEDGVLALARGTQKVNATAFGAIPISCFSKNLRNVVHRYVSLSDGRTLRDSSDFSAPTEVMSGGNAQRAVYASAFGQVLVSSGLQRRKDDGVNTYRLGVARPLYHPEVNVVQQPTLDAASRDGGGQMSAWTLEEGTNLVNTIGGYVGADLDGGTFRAVLQVIQSFDATALSDGSTGTDTDKFSMHSRVEDSENLVKIRVEFLLESPSSEQSVEDYYYKEFLNDDNSQFRKGIDVWSTLECLRGDFTRQGTDPTLDWKDVKATKIIILGSASMAQNAIDNISFLGGSKGVINGEVEYVQVNVYNSGVYYAQSQHSLPSLTGDVGLKITIKNGYANIIPNDPSATGDTQINEVWIYRRGGTLGEFYRVLVIPKVSGSFATTADTLSDDDALTLNLTLNLYRQSVQDLADEIFGILDYGERVLYLTVNAIYLSERLNPDAIDTRYTLKLFGSPTENLYWAQKVSVGTILVGSNKDVYEVSGTLNDLPDGTIEANIRNVGEKHPPISVYSVRESGTVIYMAEDGWRSTSGGASELLTASIDLLYKKYTRHGVAPVSIYTGGVEFYVPTISKGQLWVTQPMSDGTRRVFVYDLLRKYWRPYYTDPHFLFTEEDGNILALYGGGSGNFLRIIDIGNALDGTTGQSIHLQTVFDDNGQPRNRKDTFTLKITANTGNSPVDIYIAKDGGAFVAVALAQSFNGFEEKLFDIINTIGLGFRFALKIVGSSLTTCYIYNFTIEYDPRPEQLKSLRIPYNNLGSFARKRFTNYVFVIDTLGNAVTVTPLVDGASQTASTANLNRKGTYTHFFTSDTIGVDIGCLLSGGPFEYYGLSETEIVSEKLPTPVKYLVIPATDYGIPNRKRHSSYKFQINTQGANVRFTPRLDGVNSSPLVINTSERQTVEYFFTSDTIAIDIGGVLESMADTYFEFYGVIRPQQIEVLPPRLKEYFIPNDNYGIAAKKRIRTMPMFIDTNGHDVTFTPRVDGVSGVPSTLNTSGKQTAFHYFTTDIFGVDFGGELVGSFPFEFYGLLKPEEVEVIPVGKKFDQIGPVHLDRVGKIIGLRVRLIPTSAVALPFIVYGEDSVVYSGTLDGLSANADQVVEKEWITKTTKATVCRVEIGGSGAVFHRYYVELKVNFGGDKAEIKWMRVK